MIVTEETKQAAQGILDYLETYPERHHQESIWGINIENEDGFVINDGITASQVDDYKICDTTLCIAGTALYLEQGAIGLKYMATHLWQTKDGEGWIDAGSRILGLSREEAHDLFHVMSNSSALDMLRCIAAGDVDKFDDIKKDYYG